MSSQEITTFEDWANLGISKGWVSPVYCETHDGGYEYYTEEELEYLDEGGDPCAFVFRILNDDPGAE